MTFPPKAGHGHLAGLITGLLMILFPTAYPAADQDPGTERANRTAWQVEKCAVFEKALDRILGRLGEDGTSADFVANNRAYIESGCLAPVDACPETAKDIEIANGLTIATMNAGAASTFSPFRCRGPAGKI